MAPHDIKKEDVVSQSRKRLGGTGFSGWRGLGLFWAILLTVIGVGGTFLQIIGPPTVHQKAAGGLAPPSPQMFMSNLSAPTTTPIPEPSEAGAGGDAIEPDEPRLNQLIPETLSSSDPHLPGPVFEKQSADDLSIGPNVTAAMAPPVASAAPIEFARPL
jgi:hypothetical protein